MKKIQVISTSEDSEFKALGLRELLILSIKEAREAKKRCIEEHESTRKLVAEMNETMSRKRKIYDAKIERPSKQVNLHSFIIKSELRYSFTATKNTFCEL